MRKPHGNTTIVGDLSRKDPTLIEQGFFHKEAEIDTYTCAHCNCVKHVPPKCDPADLGGLCKQCMELICPRCVDKGICTPWERQMAEIEARDRFRKEAGL